MPDVGTDAPRIFGGILALSFAIVAVSAAASGDFYIVVLSVPVVLVFNTLLALSFSLEGRNVGRGRTPTGKLVRYLAAVACLDVRGCGCVYGRGLTFDTPDCSWAEREHVWIRSHDDARVTFRKAMTGMKRCHRCGKHYSATDVNNVPRYITNDSDTYHECWPEDEPDIRDQLTLPIVTEEAL